MISRCKPAAGGNLYRWRGGDVESLCPREAEFGRPQWVFGMSTYAVESENRLICTYCERGTWHLAAIDTRTNQLTDIETPFTAFGGLEAKDGHAFFTAASPALVTVFGGPRPGDLGIRCREAEYEHHHRQSLPLGA